MLFLLVSGCAHHDAALVTQLDHEVQALQARNEALWSELKKCDTPDAPLPIYQQLTQAFSGSPVTVTLRGLDVVLEIDGTLLFKERLGLALSADAAKVTDLLATALESNPDPHVWIVGHLDATPLSPPLLARFRSDWELAAFQAAQIAHALLDAGVGADRITVSSEGATPEDASPPRQQFVLVIGPEAPRR